MRRTHRAILRGPRYGLTLRAAAAAAFYLRPYRYTTVARRLTKQRVGFALHAHSQVCLHPSPLCLCALPPPH